MSAPASFDHNDSADPDPPGPNPRDIEIPKLSNQSKPAGIVRYLKAKKQEDDAFRKSIETFQKATEANFQAIQDTFQAIMKRFDTLSSQFTAAQATLAQKITEVPVEPQQRAQQPAYRVPVEP
jgi:hypothetical protein